MTGKIQILHPGIAEKIAAGEMIERPASVVKELVENALDAGATQILVRLEDGGKASIEVTDNGEGMSPQDLEISIERHATSKLKSLEDLDRIHTLGFRGEAMPSIAAVSDLSLISRPKQDPTSQDPASQVRPSDKNAAFQLQVGDFAGRLLAKPKAERITFGQFIDSEHGTHITARGLFSQVPARLKFLKSQASEVTHVRDGLERLAFAYPQTGFRLLSQTSSQARQASRETQNGAHGTPKYLLHLRPEDEMSRVRSILCEGEDFPILTLSNDQDGFRDIGLRVRVYWVQGLSTPNSRKLVQIVNSRAVRDRVIQQAILNPFRQTLLPGQFPAVVAYIDIHPAAIDVNVHPTKSEIRFLDSRKVFQTLDSLLRTLIKNHGAPAIVPATHFERRPPSPGFSEPPPWERPSFSFPTPTGPVPAQAELVKPEPAKKDAEPKTPNPDLGFQLRPPEPNWTQSRLTLPTPMKAAEEPPLKKPAFPSFLPAEQTRFVGTLFQTYLLYEQLHSEQGQSAQLILIDQHAAHERVRYEALRKRFEDLKSGGSIPSQSLLLPESIHFSADQRPLLERRLKEIVAMGFEGEIFGENIVLFRSVPADWGLAEIKTRLKNLLDRILTPSALDDTGRGEDDPSPSDRSCLWDESLFEAIASEACHSAIRAGDSLEKEEISSLIDQLFLCDHPWNCPHGRPTVVKISKGKLEEWFQRKLSSSGPEF